MIRANEGLSPLQVAYREAPAHWRAVCDREGLLYDLRPAKVRIGDNAVRGLQRGFDGYNDPQYEVLGARSICVVPAYFAKELIGAGSAEAAKE
jgi:hypothetical protein